DQAALVPRAEFNRRFARLPVRVRLLLQGGVLRGWSVLLHTDSRHRAGGDRPLARSSLVLSRRSSSWCATFRGVALRRDARDGAPLAGGRNGDVGHGFDVD